MTPAAPFFAEVADAPEGAQARWIEAADGVRLRAVAWTGGARGTALVFPGRTEYVEKYGRVVARLVARGLSVIVIDWRGQGLSDRHPMHPMLGYVEDFRDYQRDVAALLAFEASLALTGPRLLVAHSMGGCIGMRTLLERPDLPAAALSAPMLQLHLGALGRGVTTRATQLAQTLGRRGRAMPVDGPAPAGFEGNPLTSDPESFAWVGHQVIAHPELALGSPSAQWTYAAFAEMARLYWAPPPRQPALVLLGSAEAVVSSRVIRRQVARMPKAELMLLEGARHEIFMERREIVDAAWGGIDAFLESIADRQVGPAVAGLAR